MKKFLLLYVQPSCFHWQVFGRDAKHPANALRLYVVQSP